MCACPYKTHERCGKSRRCVGHRGGGRAGPVPKTLGIVPESSLPRSPRRPTVRGGVSFDIGCRSVRRDQVNVSAGHVTVRTLPSPPKGDHIKVEVRSRSVRAGAPEGQDSQSDPANRLRRSMMIRRIGKAGLRLKAGRERHATPDESAREESHRQSPPQGGGSPASPRRTQRRVESLGLTKIRRNPHTYSGASHRLRTRHQSQKLTSVSIARASEREARARSPGEASFRRRSLVAASSQRCRLSRMLGSLRRRRVSESATRTAEIKAN